MATKKTHSQHSKNTITFGEGARLWLICYCHSVFLGTSSYGLIYKNIIIDQFIA